MGISCLGSENTELAITDDASDDSQDNSYGRRSPHRRHEARALMTSLASCPVKSDRCTARELLEHIIRRSVLAFFYIQSSGLSLSFRNVKDDVCDDAFLEFV